MKRHIKKISNDIQEFDKKHTNFSHHTYWGIFIAACVVWLNTFNISLANLEEVQAISIEPVQVLNVDTISTSASVPLDWYSMTLKVDETILWIWELIADTSWESGFVIAVNSEKSEWWVVHFWPYETNLKKWEEYNVTFRLKVSNNSNTNKKILIDAYNWKMNHREFLEIAPSEFTQSDTFQEFSIRFTKRIDGYEFRSFYYPDADFTLSVDSINVELVE